MHNVQKGVVFPPDQENIFAVVQFNGSQHKIFKDDRVVLENFANDLDGAIDVSEDGDSGLAVGQQVVFKEVLMLGAADFTMLGKPSLRRVQVHATVEEMSRSEKVIIFKKKRRKGYQKNAGHKQNLVVVRIDHISLDMNEAELASATNLQQFVVEDQQKRVQQF